VCGHCGRGAGLPDQAQKNQVALFADTTYLVAVSALPPAATTQERGHGRMEQREIRGSSDLAGYSDMPGLAQVAEVRTRSAILATGAVRSQTHYLFTSLTAERASAARLLALHRGHWAIENRRFPVKDDSLGEDRMVLFRRRSEATLCALRTAALALLRGKRALWRDRDPITARRAYVCVRPCAVLPALFGS
jgi:hypothetical protein